MRLNPAFELSDVVANRQSKHKDMINFMYHFAPAIVGSVRWKNVKIMDDFSSLLTVSDEVTLAIVIENNWDKWLYLIKHDVSIMFVMQCQYVPLQLKYLTISILCGTGRLRVLLKCACREESSAV